MPVFSTFIARLQRAYQSGWGYPLFLLLAGGLAYLYPVMQLGFYWDDWEIVYLTQLATPRILQSYFFFDRPFPWTIQVYALILGAQPYLWHVLTLLLRWAGTLFFYQALVLLWPKHRSVLQWGGLLMLVYPAFVQELIATSFSRHFTAFMLCGLSFYFTALAVRSSRPRLFWVLAWVTGAAQIFTIEYFAGLELARPVFLWLLLENIPARQRLKKIALAWLPFLTVFLVFSWWRVFYYPTLLITQEYASRSRLLANLRLAPFQAVMGLLQSVWLDMTFIIGQSWLALATDPQRINLAALSTWFALGVAVLLALAANFGARREAESADGFGRQALGLGLALFLAGGIPVWVIGRLASGSGSFDQRFSIGPMAGAILLSLGLADILIKPRWQPLIFAVLLILGFFTQATLVNVYRREWTNLRNYFWQLAWRAPAIQPGTAIFAGYPPALLLPNYDASFALALLYSDKNTGSELPYWYFTWDDLKNVKLRDGARAEVIFRNLAFHGFVGQSLVAVPQPAPGCLRVADRFYAGDPVLGQQESLLSYSDLGRISPQSAHQPAQDIFGPEPPRSWCYYFQKADLARQFGHWDEVIKDYRLAETAGLAASQGGEILPLVEAYAQTGAWEKAFQAGKQALALTAGLQANLCSKWAGYASLPAINTTILAQAKTEFACP